MKKIYALILCMFVSIAAFAEVISYRTTAFYTSENNGYGWTNWSSPQYSNMLMKIDWTNDLVYIDSPSPQLYKIITITKNGYDEDGDYVAELKFYDQDGDRGTMRLVVRRSGRSQIYIVFGNVRWCYDIVRL